MALAGSWPSSQAGNAVEAASDFKWRGGMLMMSRRIRPPRTACNLAAITSMCQRGKNDAPGFSSAKQRSMNDLLAVLLRTLRGDFTLTEDYRYRGRRSAGLSCDSIRRRKRSANRPRQDSRKEFIVRQREDRPCSVGEARAALR